MASPNLQDQCIACNKRNTRRCGRCNSARYCSKKCQRDDFPVHKLLCSAFASFDISRRPSSEHIRAIFFPVEKEKPGLIWLPCKWVDDEDGRFQTPQTELFFSDDTPVPLPMLYYPVLDRDLEQSINLLCRDTFLVDGSKPNMSIASITATKPGWYHDWRGPFLAHGGIGPDMNTTGCRDLDMNDFRHVAHHFMAYGNGTRQATEPTGGNKVQGVRINCVGDRKMLKRPDFEAVELYSTEPIFYGDSDSSGIAERIGLPIFARKCPQDPRWANDASNKVFNGIGPRSNQDATFLHLSCDPQGEFDLQAGNMGWGWAPMRWQNNVGSVIVVRQNQKPLFPMQVEALCGYCRNIIRPLFGHSIGECAPEKPIGKDAVLAMICRPTFVIHWYNLLEEKRKEGKDTDVPYPYDDVSFG